MPKRINNIYTKICNELNIDIADLKARRGKGNRFGVIKHDKLRDVDNRALYNTLKDCKYRTSPYTTYKIYEPKERTIFRLPYYPDRITHHAIMNIMEPIWTKIFTRDTYSCIKNKGIHALLRKLLNDLKLDQQGTKYCLKLDIKKFYPSINHEILKLIIRKKIKDKCLLKLMDEIIDSAEGVPIGNYLSLFFANLYLAYFDHWIKEELKVKYYYRYADDIVLLSNDKKLLRNWLLAIKIYLSNVLKLRLKDNYLIYPVESRGIDFVGYVFYHNYTKLRKSIKHRMFKVIKNYNLGKITKSELKSRLNSYFGWLKYCNSKHLLQKVSKQTKIKYTGWNGTRVNINSIKLKYIHLVTILARKKYFLLLFTRNKNPAECKSSNIKLFKLITSRKCFPLTIKINDYV